MFSYILSLKRETITTFHWDKENVFLQLKKYFQRENINEFNSWYGMYSNQPEDMRVLRGTLVSTVTYLIPVAGRSLLPTSHTFPPDLVRWPSQGLGSIPEQRTCIFLTPHSGMLFPDPFNTHTKSTIHQICRELGMNEMGSVLQGTHALMRAANEFFYFMLISGKPGNCDRTKVNDTGMWLQTKCMNVPEDSGVSLRPTPHPRAAMRRPFTLLPPATTTKALLSNRITMWDTQADHISSLKFSTRHASKSKKEKRTLLE